MKRFFGLERKFGFGCMRLPLVGEEVDIPQFSKMVDRFLEEGFIYFDTAHGYLNGKSETAIKTALTSRYSRESYILTDKLTKPYFSKEEDVRPFFESQLKACGVDYFDFYLMHAQNKDIYQHFQKCHAYEVASQLKKEGKIKHLGISFHDTAEVLDQILTEHPEIEVVQIQFNYLDYEDPAVQSRLCYETCVKHAKPVIIMEPVRGGRLIELPDKAKAILDESGEKPAHLAIRFAASPENVMIVLSGMSTIEQMEDNISFMKDFKPLDPNEMLLSQRIASAIREENLIGCTACRYCVAGCPKHILIPDLFACLNTKEHFHDWNAEYYYNTVYTVGHGKASECIRCGKCEAICPQKLPIRDLLRRTAEAFEN